MIHARDDYNRIQDPGVENPSLLPKGATPIAEDEPVFLIRAQDRLSVEALEYYAFLAGRAGLHEIAAATLDQVHRIRLWQVDNPSKLPDLREHTTEGTE